MEKWELLAALLESKAKDRQVTAKLWETDPEKFGTDLAHLSEWRAHGEGLAEAAEMVRRTFGALSQGG